MKKIDWGNPKSIDSIAQLLQLGKIVAGTSDTVMGLLAPLTQDGFEQLNAIKGRQNKPYLILVVDKKYALALSDDFNKPAVQALIDRYWPGPLTIIVRAKLEIPDYMKSSDGTIAIRVPNHAGLQALLQRFEGLFSTSANKAGEAIPSKIEEIHSDIANQVACLVNGQNNQSIASTIIDATGNQIKVIRKGALAINF